MRMKSLTWKGQVGGSHKYPISDTGSLFIVGTARACMATRSYRLALQCV
jgi:hypothetical protein